MTTPIPVAHTTDFPLGPIDLSTFHSLSEIVNWANDKHADEVWYYRQIAFKQETYLAATKSNIQSME